MALRKTSFRVLPRKSTAWLLVAFSSAAAIGSPKVSFAQSTAPTSEAPAPAANPTAQAATKPWIVRDPATGRVFQQQLVPVTVPVTRWEAKTIDQTVYEPQFATNLQPYPQTTFVPKTEYVMQPKVRGWWNPLQQPVQSYEYVPKTTWVPQTQQLTKPVVTQNWVPKQQKIVVYQPVQATEVRQQLVQTELPQPGITPPAGTQPAFTQPAGSPPTAIAYNTRPPLIRLPILAQQRVLPWPTANTNSYAAQPPAATYAQIPTQPVTPPATQPVTQLAANPVLPPPAPAATSGLRPVVPYVPSPPFPIPRFATRPYAAPLQPITSTQTASTRDTLQSGMQATVLR